VNWFSKLFQISKIQEILGSPLPEETTFIRNVKARSFLASLPERPKVAWHQLYPRVLNTFKFKTATSTPPHYPNSLKFDSFLTFIWFQADKNGLELLNLLLTFDPSKRINVEESLAHKYFSAYYDPSDEPVAENPFTFEMEFDELPTRELKQMIYR